MTRHVKIGETKRHLSALLAEVEAGEERPALRATIRRDRTKQKAVATDEILSWRHEGHAR